MNFKGIEICCPDCRGDLAESAPGEVGPACRAGSIAGQGQLVREAQFELECLACRRRYPVVAGIPDLRVFPDPYIGVEEDRAKGERIAARLGDLSFAELVDFYYSTTPAVPPRHARLYARGLMAAGPRAEAGLVSWLHTAPCNSVPPGRRDLLRQVERWDGTRGSLLDVGCGTGPLLVSAASRFETVVGVDIALRWLVVAKKRLSEAGLDVPLICACAEALPLADATIDRVAFDSTLEHVRDQRQSLAESARVMRQGGCLFVSTPNRFSLGPDPQAGLWGGGYLPQRWLAAYVRWQGGIPPRRRLLTARSLSKLIEQAGFAAPAVRLPEVPAGQRCHFGAAMRLLIDVYQLARSLPGSRELLRWIGPQLHAVALKTASEANGSPRAGRPASRPVACPAAHAS